MEFESGNGEIFSSLSASDTLDAIWTEWDLLQSGQGGNDPGAFATSPTEDAYRFSAQASTWGSDNTVAALMSGSKWSSADAATATTIITYSFADPLSSTFSYAGPSNFQATLTTFSAADRQLTRELLAKIEAVANVQFVEVADNASQCGVLRYGYSQGPNAMNYAGWAFYPSSASNGGDIWIGTNQSQPQWDFYRPNLILHETLHAMGLKHPFSDGAVLPMSADIIPNTVMSYSPVAGSTNGSMSLYPDEPMALDIAALQFMYGATAANAGNAGNTVYDLATAEFQAGFRALWDASGVDLLDASRVDHGVVLNLGAGGASDVGLNVAAQALGGGSYTVYEGTLTLAAGVVIESATGSAFNDSLVGNGADNRLQGGAGQDAIDGGLGLDTAVYAGARANFSVSRSASGFVVTDASGSEGSDSLSSVERLNFSDRGVALDLSGNAGAVAKIIGAVFGAATVGNAQYVGIGLDFLDGGMSQLALTQLAIDARLGGPASNAAVVELLYTNVAGQAPSASALASYVGLLDQGTYSQASLGMLAAETDLNIARIDLVGLATVGLDYGY